MIEYWYPTPVYYNMADIATKIIIDSEYRGQEHNILKDLKPLTWGDNISSTFESSNLIEKYRLKNLEKLILRSAKEFYPEKEFYIHSSWANYAKKYCFQNQHTHMGHSVSGVYYIQTNENDGNFKIAPIIPELCANNIFIEYNPQVGKIILFPSWVPHSVMVNLTDSTRISVAFNLNLI